MAVKKARKARGHKKPGTTKDAAEQRARRFVEAYIANGGNATSAAIQAGYSPRSAYNQGYRLMKDDEVGRLLEQRKQQVAKRLEISTERILRKLVAIAEADVSQFLDSKGAILPPSEWPAEARGAVQSLKWGRFGPEIKLHDSKGAVEIAMKHLGLFEKDNEQKADPIKALLDAIAGEAGLVPVAKKA